MKRTNYFHFKRNKNQFTRNVCSLRKFQALTIIFLLTSSVAVKAQLPTAQKVASEMTVGWNMGNTLEAICGETVWGAANTTQRLIDSVKAAGFNTIRIPVAWFCHSDTITSQIDPEWMARVAEVVDYCINDGLYVVMNDHWDQGWLENRVNAANQNIVNQRQYAYWSQIADYFQDYDEHLLFAGANEPNVEDAKGMEILLSYHQTFIDAVRETGGNNASRTLIIQGPSTDIDKTNKLMNTLPTDVIEDRLMIEIHYYTPYQFCIMSSDASWGKVFYYWGKDFHSTTDVTRNSTWGEETELDRLFGLMKTKFVDKGIPVIIGEFGAYKRKLSPPSDQALHNKSVVYFNKYVVKSAVSKGIIPYYWDTPGGLFDRSSGKVNDEDLLNAMMEGAGLTNSTQSDVPSIYNSVNLYPIPFTSTINLEGANIVDIVEIKIFDSLGKQVEYLTGSAISRSINMDTSLKSGLYFIQIYGTNWAKSFKAMKY